MLINNQHTRPSRTAFSRIPQEIGWTFESLENLPDGCVRRVAGGQCQSGRIGRVKSFTQAYLDRLAVPQRLVTMVRRLGEHKGRQELYQRQAP